MDKYAKVKKIGEGAFGLAYLARSKEQGRQVVLKEINMNRMSQKERVEARKEVAVLSQLMHSNIVSYLESFEDAGTLVIVMDYCDGGDLYTKINNQRGTPFAEEQIVDWFVQMCLAIKHIHDRKILHRDIKSQNIFLTRHGMIKLGDFGIAKVLNSTVELAKTCIGTPYYLSPEICEARPYNNKSDVWSLGCVLYELTNLKHAFEAGSMNMLIQKIIRGNFPPPSSRYSADLRSLILELFRKSPRERPSINAVLKKPLLQAKIRKFLTALEIAEEFSHTVMHGVRLQKAIVPISATPVPPRPLPPKPVAVRKPPSPSPSVPPSRYNPAAVYGPSVARKSKDTGNNRKSQESRRSGSRASGGSANSRPSSAQAPATPDMAKRRQELIEKEKERREEIRKRQEADFAKQHQDLMNKQKQSRMQKQREEGWRNILTNGEESPVIVVAKKDVELKPAPLQFGAVNAVAVRELGNYDHHVIQLQKLNDVRDKGGAFNPAMAARQGQIAANAGASAAERARVQQDFILGRQAALANRVRGQGEFQFSPRVAAAVPGPQGDRLLFGAQKNSAKDIDDEESIRSRLQKIRQQNLAGGNAQGVQNKDKSPINEVSEVEQRRQKIEAIKAQAADTKEKRLKAELEKKRREGYEIEQKRLQQAASRPYTAPPERPIGSSNAIGLTAAMQAVSLDAPKRDSEILKRKEGILKRINAKVSDRPKWNEAERQAVLGSLDLEFSSQGSGASSSPRQDKQTTPDVCRSSPPRDKWAAPGGTMMNVLRNADISDTSEVTRRLSGTFFTAMEIVELDESDSDSKDKFNLNKPETVVATQAISSSRDESPPSKVEADHAGTRGVVAIALSTGRFDLANVTLLRTCSEPDLTQFARPTAPTATINNSNVDVCVRQSTRDDFEILGEILDVENERPCDKDDESLIEGDAMMSVGDLIDENASPEELNTSRLSDSDGNKSNEEDEEDDDEDDDDDIENSDQNEDLATLHAIMIDHLSKKDDCSSDEEPPLSASVNKMKKKKKGRLVKKGRRKRAKETALEGKGPWCDETAENLQKLKATIKSLLLPESQGADASAADNLGPSSIPGSQAANSDFPSDELVTELNEGDLTLVSALPEHSSVWQSDDGSDDYFEDTADQFSRLEEIRACLEDELGLDVLRKAYLAVQSLNEKEEENADDGIKEITKILGADKVNPYYPLVLQLVMADGAYTEGND